MPNPFMRSTQQNTSDESMTPDRPKPTDPILETYEGSNHPYRGIETHGVQDTGKPTDPMTEWSADPNRKIAYEEPPKEIEPVPVRIVESGSRELIRTRGMVLTVPSDRAARLLGRNPNRRKCTVRNDGPEPISLAFGDNDGSVLPNSTWLFPSLAVGSSQDFLSDDAIYAIASNGSAAVVSAVNDPVNLNTFIGSNIVAGASHDEIVPAGQYWNISSVRASLTASAAVANRRAALIIRDAANNIIGKFVSGYLETAGQTVTYTWATTGHQQPPNTVLFNDVTIAIPNPLIVGPGYHIQTATELMDVADDWSSLIVNYIGGDASIGQASVTVFEDYAVELA